MYLAFGLERLDNDLLYRLHLLSLLIRAVLLDFMHDHLHLLRGCHVRPGSHLVRWDLIPWVTPIMLILPTTMSTTCHTTSLRAAMASMTAMPWLVPLVGSLIVRVVSLSTIALTVIIVVIVGATLGSVGVPMVEIKLLVVALITTVLLLVCSHIFHWCL